MKINFVERQNLVSDAYDAGYSHEIQVYEVLNDDGSHVGYFKIDIKGDSYAENRYVDGVSVVTPTTQTITKWS